MSDAQHGKGEFFDVEAFLRANVSPAQLLELDGILCNMELKPGERLVEAQACIERLVEGVKK